MLDRSAWLALSRGSVAGATVRSVGHQRVHRQRCLGPFHIRQREHLAGHPVQIVAVAGDDPNQQVVAAAQSVDLDDLRDQREIGGNLGEPTLPNPGADECRQRVAQRPKVGTAPGRWQRSRAPAGARAGSGPCCGRARDRWRLPARAPSDRPAGPTGWRRRYGRSLAMCTVSPQSCRKLSILLTGSQSIVQIDAICRALVMADQIIGSARPRRRRVRVADGALESLALVEQRVLWLSTAMIDHANRVRPDTVRAEGRRPPGVLRVDGLDHDVLWFDQLRPGDRVSVKPHASPVLHAINYLLGALDEKYLTTLRDIRRLCRATRAGPRIPTRSTTRRVRWESVPPRRSGARSPAATWSTTLGSTGAGRQYSLVGDAELDEGAVWEAILDPSVRRARRDRLDRRHEPSVAGPGGAQYLGGTAAAMFAAAGWQVITVKFGQAARGAVRPPGRMRCGAESSTCPTPNTNACFGATTGELRAGCPETGPTRTRSRAAHRAGSTTRTPMSGGQQPGRSRSRCLVEAFAGIDDNRPTVIFAYTVKGYGLPNARPPAEPLQPTDPRADHRARRTARHGPRGSLATVRTRTPEHQWCAMAATRLARAPIAIVPPPSVPTDLGRTPTGRGSTQQALGRALLDLTRQAPDAARALSPSART